MSKELSEAKAVSVCFYLLRLWLTYHEATKPKAIACAKAALYGALGTLDRTGLTGEHTEFGIYMEMQEVIRAAGDRPGYRAVNNTEQQDWDRAVAVALAIRLELLNV